MMLNYLLFTTGNGGMIDIKRKQTMIKHKCGSVTFFSNYIIFVFCRIIAILIAILSKK